MKNDFNPEDLTIPAELQGRQWLTLAEFGSLIGVSGAAINNWRRKGIIKSTQFTPRCVRIPISEVGRLQRGELMSNIKC